MKKLILLLIGVSMMSEMMYAAPRFARNRARNQQTHLKRASNKRQQPTRKVSAAQRNKLTSMIAHGMRKNQQRPNRAVNARGRGSNPRRQAKNVSIPPQRNNTAAQGRSRTNKNNRRIAPRVSAGRRPVRTTITRTCAVASAAPSVGPVAIIPAPIIPPVASPISIAPRPSAAPVPTVPTPARSAAPAPAAGSAVPAVGSIAINPVPHRAAPAPVAHPTAPLRPILRQPDAAPRAEERRVQFIGVSPSSSSSGANGQSAAQTPEQQRIILNGAIAALAQAGVQINSNQGTSASSSSTSAAVASSSSTASSALPAQAASAPAAEQKICSVCQEHTPTTKEAPHESELNPVIRLQCTHEFCLPCILNWVRGGIRPGNTFVQCPLCRADVHVYDPLEVDGSGRVTLVTEKTVPTDADLRDLQELRSNAQIVLLAHPERTKNALAASQQPRVYANSLGYDSEFPAERMTPDERADNIAVISRAVRGGIVDYTALVGALIANGFMFGDAEQQARRIYRHYHGVDPI